MSVIQYVYNLDDLSRVIYNWLCSVCNYWGIPVLVLNILLMTLIAFCILGVASLFDIVLVYMERKIMGHMQSRIGIMRVGWHGVLQPIADAIKMLSKEDLIPANADRRIFIIAPIVAFIGAFLPYMAIPFAKGITVYDINIGILYIIAAGSLGVIGILMAGWSSNNKYSILGGLRGAGQLISYEIPVVLSVIGVIMLTGSMKMGDIVSAQKDVPFIIYQPIGFIIYLIAGIAELNRTPFDIPEGDSEIVAGYHTEYSGMKFGVFYIAEYTAMFAVSAIITTLFLGGWQGPFLPPVVWFFIKTLLIAFVLIWIRWTFPRLRIDQLMNFSWKVLIPLGFLNLIVTGIIILVIK